MPSIGQTNESSEDISVQSSCLQAALIPLISTNPESSFYQQKLSSLARTLNYLHSSENPENPFRVFRFFNWYMNCFSESSLNLFSIILHSSTCIFFSLNYKANSDRRQSDEYGAIRSGELRREVSHSLAKSNIPLVSVQLADRSGAREARARWAMSRSGSVHVCT